MKCLPSSKLPLAHGNILHDWHAEVLAIRSFNRFLLDECLLLLDPAHAPSRFIQRRASHAPEQPPFTIKQDVSIYMYCSEAPCGDASMELVMEAQEDATPWTTPPSLVQHTTDSAIPGTDITTLRGRSHFGHLGAVRLKPSRPDAPPTLSKSCSDKIALTQATSLLLSVTSLLMSPQNAYLTALVLPDSQLNETACTRAFKRSGRMGGITPTMENKWTGGYRWHGFDVLSTTREFEWSRRSATPPQKLLPSNISTIKTPHFEQTLIGGVLQGRKQFDPRGASMICRRSMWRCMLEIAGVAGLPALSSLLRKETYGEVKSGELLEARRQVKREVREEVLQGWVRNGGDEVLRLDGENRSVR
jgi:tRNA-specific adenosine deaminase 1